MSIKVPVIAFVLFAVTVPLYPSVEIKMVQPRYLEEKDFERIQEYLTGKEVHGRRLIMRTQPARRAGLYFILTLSRSASTLPSDAKIRIELVPEGEPNPKSFTLEFPENRRHARELFVGLTGSHWPDPDTTPLAWKVSLVGPTNEIIHQKESFLWR